MLAGLALLLSLGQLSPPPPPIPEELRCTPCPGATEAPRASASRRLRFGIGSWAGIGSLPANVGNDIAFGLLGFTVQGGVQIDDRFGAVLLVQGATIALSSVFSLHALADFTFEHTLSVGTGIGLAGGHISGAFRSEALSVALGVPLRFTLTPGGDPGANPRRHRFFIALELFGGMSVAGYEPPLRPQGQFALSLGYVMM